MYDRRVEGGRGAGGGACLCMRFVGECLCVDVFARMCVCVCVYVCVCNLLHMIIVTSRDSNCVLLLLGRCKLRLRVYGRRWLRRTNS